MKLSVRQYVLKYSCIAVIAVLLVLGMLITSARSRQTIFAISTNQYFEYIKGCGGYGSEPPRVIYADSQKVIIDNIGLIIFDYKSKSIQILDTCNIARDKIDCFVDYAVSADGRYIYMRYTKDGDNDFISAFSYNIQKDKKKPISEQRYIEKLTGCVRPVYPDSTDELITFTKGGSYVADNDGRYYTVEFDNDILYLLVLENHYVNRYEVFRI